MFNNWNNQVRSQVFGGETCIITSRTFFLSLLQAWKSVELYADRPGSGDYLNEIDDLIAHVKDL